MQRKRESKESEDSLIHQKIELIKRHEGFRSYAYPDPASPLALATPQFRRRWGREPASVLLALLPEKINKLSAAPWTCGYGETKGVGPDDFWTEAEASARLEVRYKEFEDSVLRACTAKPNANQLAAMTSLCYNIGPAGFKRSTVLKAHNRGDHQAAARAFGLWNKSGGKVYAGLTRRRSEEAALYLTPEPDDVGNVAEGLDLAMPQRIDAERPMTASTINRASVVAGGTAAVATVAETARTVADVKYSAQSLGDWLVPALLVCVVLLCGYVAWERIRQRREGWA